MANITLSLNDDLVLAGRTYAKRHGVSLNRLIRTLLAKVVGVSPQPSSLENCFQLMDKARATSRGRRWSRDELYRG